ncbi:MAG: phosphonopyruvate decarboxylase [Verrucomicrobiae bacterium]|nr:phosphonopyruvate decarboxylase [Verrucomicrobiae bacterium]NNJ42514.1 phosphonopyruvate decarboxylase [Akkermansiaceae bacterium]
MIDCISFHQALSAAGLGLYAGVPDSLLKEICACITDQSPEGAHIIAANEGAAVALASGSYLATGKPGMVYMQNSGYGNTVNPLLSLADPKVYSIPMLLMIGWRGEPGIKDEPQHVKQGEVTLELLDVMGIPYEILPTETESAIQTMNQLVAQAMERHGPVAMIVRKNTFEKYESKSSQEKTWDLTLRRERAIGIILEEIDAQVAIVSTTGMASREIFEYRASRRQGHHRDFLTVGSMGHCSQIAMGVAVSNKGQHVCCIDGDGAVIMHMGSLAITGQYRGGNLLHIILNNGKHDSVGGQPTVGFEIDIPAIALACGYEDAVSVTSEQEIRDAVKKASSSGQLTLIEIRVLPGARSDLGRPSTTPIQNRDAFMSHLQD